MSAHFAGEDGVGFDEFVFDERVTGFAHRGDAAGGVNCIRQNARAFDVKDDFARRDYG